MLQQHNNTSRLGHNFSNGLRRVRLKLILITKRRAAEWEMFSTFKVKDAGVFLGIRPEVQTEIKHSFSKCGSNPIVAYNESTEIVIPVKSKSLIDLCERILGFSKRISIATDKVFYLQKFLSCLSSECSLCFLIYWFCIERKRFSKVMAKRVKRRSSKFVLYLTRDNLIPSLTKSIVNINYFKEVPNKAQFIPFYSAEIDKYFRQ